MLILFFVLPCYSAFSQSNDVPCNAQEIIVGCTGSMVEGNNTSNTDSGIISPSCGTYSGGDYWSYVLVPASGNIKIEVYPLDLFNLDMAVYSSSSDCNGVFTELVCDQLSGVGNMPKVFVYNQTPYDTIYIRIWDVGNDDFGFFLMDASDLDNNYCLTGDAVDLGGGCALLTPPNQNQKAAIWDADDRMDFTKDFTFDFNVNFGNLDLAGADGITFTMHNDPDALQTFGSPGEYLGAGGISNSLIIEMDTWINATDKNDSLPGMDCSNTIHWDHMDLWLNGNINPGNCSSGARIISKAVPFDTNGVLYNIENGLKHTFRISYDEYTQTISAELLDSLKLISYGSVSYSPFDPLTVFGCYTPYFGFTASTGGSVNSHSSCLSPEFINPLPVELIDFNVACSVGELNFTWSTASEKDNDFFAIQELSGVDFKDILTLEGNGTTNQQSIYQINVDNNLSDNLRYFRLKQVDLDGSISYSNVISSNCSGVLKYSIQPNPVKDKFKILFDTYVSDLSYQLFDASGRLIDKQNLTDVNKIEFNFSQNLTDGIYLLKLNLGGKLINERIVRL